MKRVTGLGGVFFKCANPTEMTKWYEKHLGIVSKEGSGALFEWRTKDNPADLGHTVWSPFADKTTYFQPSSKDFMFNYRVENLEELLNQLKEEGVQIVGEVETYDYGKFGWIMDPEGNKIELWEPKDADK